MRRLALLVSFVIVVLVGSLVFSRITPGTIAQEATPAAGAITVELLGHGLPNAAPGFDLQLYRATIAPGAGIPPHTHPGGSVVYVESGTMAFTSLEGEAYLIRAGTMATPEAEGELLAHDTEVTLTAGDALFWPDEHGDEAYNVGEEPLVLLLANLYTEGEPILTLMATPTP
jgi:mannose-6-phosphate isomerase-like protein (cupin superfamily)